MIKTGAPLFSEISNVSTTKDSSADKYRDLLRDQNKKDDFKAALRKESQVIRDKEVQESKELRDEKRIDIKESKNIKKENKSADQPVKEQIKELLVELENLLEGSSEPLGELGQFLQTVKEDLEAMGSSVKLSAAQINDFESLVEQINQQLRSSSKNPLMKGQKAQDLAQLNNKLNELLSSMSPNDNNIDTNEIDLKLDVIKAVSGDSEGSSQNISTGLKENMANFSDNGSSNQNSQFGQAMGQNSSGKINAASALNSDSSAFKLESAEQAVKDNLPNIIEKARFVAQKGGGNMRVQMTPEGMGTLDLQVAVKDGQVSIEVLTQNKEMKSLLEGSLVDLKNSLIAKDVDLESIKVDVSQELSADLKENEDSLDQQLAREFLQEFRENNSSWKKDLYGSEALEKLKAQSVENMNYGMRARPMRSSGLLNVVA